MSANRRRRLERLESRQSKGRPWFDPFDACMRLWVDLQAVVAGKACWIPRPEAELGEAAQDAFDRMVAEGDIMARRLTAEVPQDA
jgi:hypothetical protein